MSFWDRIGLPPRLVALCGLLFLVVAPMIALGSGTANLPNNPNAAVDQGPGPSGEEGWPFAVVNATGTSIDVNLTGSAVNQCVTQCTNPWVVSGTVTANQGTAGALAWPVSASQSGTWTVNQGTAGASSWPVNAAQSGTWTVQQGTPPWSVSQSGTWTVQQGTPPWSIVGTLTNNNAAPAANNVGVLPSVANASAPTLTEGRQTLLSTDLSGNLRVLSTGSGTSTVQGNLTNNNAAPVANNLGVLPAVSNAADPTRTEGNQVLLSTDLNGRVRTVDDHPTVFVSASFNRPANTTTYTINHYMSNSTTTPTLLTIPGCARVNGGSGRITSAILLDEANQSTALLANVMIFDSTSVAAHNDNAATAESNADLEHLVHVLATPASNMITNAGTGSAGNIALPFLLMGNTGIGNTAFQCQPGSTSLSAIFTAANAYVPISSEKFVLRLGIQQD